MAYLHIQVWLPLFALFTGTCALTDAFSREPVNQTVRAGETVTFHCTVASSRSTYLYVYWYKSFGYSNSPSMPISSARTINSNADSRYSIVGTGLQYNLQIRDVEVGDTSYYKCRYYNGQFFDSQIAELNVFDESRTPRCQYQPLNPEVGAMVSISCAPGSPASRSSLTLWRGTHGYQVTNLNRQSDGSITYRFQLRENDNNREYTCNNGRTYDNIHNCSVTPLSIKSTISFTPGVNYGMPGDEIRFSCQATGVPAFSSYRWLLGVGASTLRITTSVGRYIFSTNGDSARLTILGLKLSDNNTAVRCVAVNNLGHREMALGKIIVQSPHHIPTDVITTAKPIAVQTTHGSVVQEFPLDVTTVMDHREKAVLKSEPPIQGVSSENTSQKENSTNVKISLNKSPNKKNSVALPIILTLLVVLVIVIIIIFIILIKKTDKPPPELLKRLSLRKPAVLKRISVRRPQFLERFTIRKSWQGAKLKVEAGVDALQKRATWGGRPNENEEKRKSLRDQIEVVVNPPPPEWKLKVEDVNKAQRNRLMSHHAPTGGYSAKEKDLLNSLMTGTIQMKTLERVEGIDIISVNPEDVESQSGSDIEEEGTYGISDKERERKGKLCEPQDKEERPKIATIVTNDTDAQSRSETENTKQDIEAEVVYANSSVAMGKENDNEDSLQADDPKEVKYAELDLKISGPWDARDIIQTEAKTAYAVIDHRKKTPVVRSTCNL